MKKKEQNEGLDHLDPNLIEKYVDQKDTPEQKNKRSHSVWLRLAAIAVCSLLIVSALVVVPMILQENKEDSSETIDQKPDNRPNIPIVNIQAASSAPRYYGEKYTEGESGIYGDVSPEGISVTAKLVETLPDTYTFFDDWHQYEFRLLRMQTVKLLKGQEMTEEFYYLVPVGFMTDFSVFDCFVIKDMAQFTYEYSVMYNKTQDKAEQFDLVIFGYRVYGYYLMGENFAAFDAYDDFDEIIQAEEAIQNEEFGRDKYVHLLKDISGEAADILTQIKSLENGMFVPKFSTDKLFLTSEVQFHAVRFINGFTTNEKISIWCKEWDGGDQDTYAFTNARFNEDDMKTLPDLTSAFEAVKEGLNSGLVTPPHFDNQETLKATTSAVFGWYAKTDTGVVGIIRVTWCFSTEKYPPYYDDAYYIIEYGEDECKPIDRDALLERLGDCEATYIYTGKYNEYGKIIDIVYY
ncbi:MAG: hypothetical protein IJ011_10765 [Clostridia bacterium]|nr:hypothetical protein [Clostridia bacterium]MBQ8850804.1 hypothetical protein [Clostridia bacterium]